MWFAFGRVYEIFRYKYKIILNIYLGRLGNSTHTLRYLTVYDNLDNVYKMSSQPRQCSTSPPTIKNVLLVRHFIAINL